MKENQKNDEISVLQKAKEITTNEVQLLQWPYFCVSTAHSNDTEFAYTELLKLHGGEIKRRWVVRCHDTFGWPGQLEADVWRSVEHIMHLQRERGTLSNPVITTLGQIRKYMPGRWRGGRDLKLIVKAIKCLTHTRVDCDFFYDARQKISRNASFSLVHEWMFERRRKPDGTEVLEKTKLLIHPDVFNNIAAAHVRPLDRGFRDGLSSWLGKRLYEVLGVKFYALRKKEVPYRTRYSRLCALLGCKRQRYLSYAKRILGRAHKELQESEFLGQVEWYPCTTDPKDWVIHYWPGERARREWTSEYFQRGDFSIPLFMEDLPTTDSEPVWMEGLQSDETQTTAEVVSRVFDNPESRGRLPSAQAQAQIGSAPPVASTPAGDGPAVGELTDEAVITTFERVTGSSRRMRSLSEAERAHLQSWREAGVTLEVVEAGIHRVLERASEGDRSLGRISCSVWSLDYCAWAIREVYEERLRVDEGRNRQREVECLRRAAADNRAKRSKTYAHMTEWTAVCERLKSWLTPRNYTQVTRGIVSSRLNEKTLELVVCDPYWRDHILGTYRSYFLEASGAEALEVEVEVDIDIDRN